MRDSVPESIEPMRSEAIPQVERPTQVSDLLASMLGQRFARGASEGERAIAAWFGANGDRERAHTTRVFLRKPKAAGLDPVMCVYVDSHAYATDLNANRDLYLGRLANWGFYVSGIEFAVDRNAHRQQGQVQQETTRSSRPRNAVASPATPQEQARIDDLLKEAPESLKASISKAILASLRSKGQF